jgi:HlyD family secretion protein
MTIHKRLHHLQRWTKVFLPDIRTMLAAGVTLLLCCVTIFFLIWPSYKNPKARMYTSKLGYASVLRKTGQAFPVQTASVELRDIEVRFLGEGLVQSEPVQVPMVGMARIEKVCVEEGDFVKAGDVLVLLDESRIRNKIAGAKAALTTAQAELRRVSIGTVNVLDKERPDRERIRLNAMEREADILKQLMATYTALNREKFVSEQDVLEKELETVRATASFHELQLNTTIAEEGLKESLRMAECSIQEAALQVEYRELELRDYQSIAPADGIVERVLVHEGEYNQDPGRPAMLLASGLWFELYLDQTAMGQIDLGGKVEVRLAAFQNEVFEATVTKVRPLVHFSHGGPETNRPIRPLGTGSPEWPATFSVRATFINPSKKIVPGLTGFGRAVLTRKSLTVPEGSVTGISGNRGIAYVVDESGRNFELRPVTTAATHDGWLEVVDGLKLGERVIVEGHQVLEQGDLIQCESVPEMNRIEQVQLESPSSTSSSVSSPISQSAQTLQSTQLADLP